MKNKKLLNLTIILGLMTVLVTSTQTVRAYSVWDLFSFLYISKQDPGPNDPPTSPQRPPNDPGLQLPTKCFDPDTGEEIPCEIIKQ
jgi:hypothetical protein